MKKAEIINHRGSDYSLRQMPEDLFKDLSPHEKLIVEARCSGLSFFQLDFKNDKTEIDKILLHGAAITGSNNELSEFFGDVVSQEVFSFLIGFGYEELTVLEVILAMRINCRGGYLMPDGRHLEEVKFYGNCFNVSFLATVLENYLHLRKGLETKIQDAIDGKKK